MVSDKVAEYYTRMGGMTGQLTAEAFRAAIDALADGKQLGALVPNPTPTCSLLLSPSNLILNPKPGPTLARTPACFCTHSGPHSGPATLCSRGACCRSAGRLAMHRPMFNATIVGKTYIPDYRRRLRRRLLL